MSVISALRDFCLFFLGKWWLSLCGSALKYKVCACELELCLFAFLKVFCNTPKKPKTRHSRKPSHQLFMGQKKTNWISLNISLTLLWDGVIIRVSIVYCSPDADSKLREYCPFNQEKLNFRCFFCYFCVFVFGAGACFVSQIFCVFLVSVVSDLKTCLMKTEQFFVYGIVCWIDSANIFFWRQVFLVSGNFLVFVIIFSINFALLLHGNFC